MKKSDAKDFASTKHKKLPEKKVAKEATDFSQRDKVMKKAKPLHKHLFKNLHKGDRKGDVNEGYTANNYNKLKAKIGSANKHRKPSIEENSNKSDVNERIDYDDSKQMKKYADEKKKHKEQDKRMKFGKFYKRAEDARDRLRPGEVKRYDKAKGKWVSNKD
jgi:hypothetical protein